MHASHLITCGLLRGLWTFSGSTEPKSPCADQSYLLEKHGGRDWDRTSDPCDVNAVLIPLSYAPDRYRKASISGEAP